MSRLVLGPFNRVEGDLEIRLDVQDGRVREARVNSPLYRGFEQILLGRPALDALVIAPRICGICSVSQSSAAVAALAQLAGASMAENGRLSANLALACENLADHLTHFYLFFMPDFARAAYAGKSWHPHAVRRFAAVKGEASADFLPARSRLLHVMGLLAGKWPHSLALQPGGTTKPVDAGEKMRLLAILGEFRAFLERHVFAAPLEQVAGLENAAQLQAWKAEKPEQEGDFRFFLHLAETLELDRLGRATDRFLSYGGFFRRGQWHHGDQSLDANTITEDLSHAWMTGDTAHPTRGHTLPDADKDGAYSWCKAPRLDGEVAEVGALARQVVDGHPLLRDLVRQSGGNVRNRVTARLIEAARLVPLMEGWARALRPREPFCLDVTLPDQGSGAGLVEAARGALGHWLRVENGRIAGYQIIAPTTWNFSPRDAQGQPGALEQALVGTPVSGNETMPLAVQHVVRSFDPCSACTVH